ncbi:D-2-hydroxyacid dehydrogenase family protein [Martelella sp. HB161492]|uniref:D-2-hydroxyacid dehydrogenase family protein n=1 Tax=Martelella sp. HB161492 TaxID=2720726 RepID=UPI0015914539|nr:D-2-hydroxyacid dehydrogenase family protein [Martelella sp. HB161492]
MRIDVLDDWADIAESAADWSELRQRADVIIHRTALAGDALAAALSQSDVIVPLRERSVFDRRTLLSLDRLKLVAQTGATVRHFDIATLRERGVTVCWSGDYHPEETAEFAFGLMIAAERGIVDGAAAIARGGFMEQTGLGRRLSGRTLGILGPGRIGGRLARMALAADMKVLAWSRSLDRAEAAARDITAVSRDELMAQSDIVSLNLPLTPQTRGMIGRGELALMKPGALILNTARAALVDGPALLEALTAGRIRAALDVFEEEPLPADHPFRRLQNVTLTPHLGYATQECMGMFYRQSIENILAFIDGNPVRVLDF